MEKLRAVRIRPHGEQSEKWSIERADGKGGGLGEVWTEKDAVLLAAAPEMLEALKACSMALPLRPQKMQDAWLKASAAIRKAEGLAKLSNGAKGLSLVIHRLKCASSRAAAPVVVIHVRGGVAEVFRKSPGVRVRIRDFDNDGGR